MVAIRIAQAVAVSVTAVTAMAVLMAPASAVQAPAMRAGSTLSLAAHARPDSRCPCTAKPKSNITGTGNNVVYSPASLNAKWSGPTKQTCTAKNASFTIANTTKTSETVTQGGAKFGTIAAGKTLDVCAWGSGTSTEVFGLAANNKATLTVQLG